MVSKNQKPTKRPPVVVVLGHVDHGKTTLLDALRKTRVATREAGGITQGIGASVVTSAGGDKITFIDTPGHAAFNKMRERGAKIADLAVLVVAGDDGIKPQTAEAIGYIDSTKTPYLIAITKSDLPNSDPDKVKSQLVDNGVELDGLGGDVPAVVVSAKNAKGLDELLEMVLLVAEVTEIKGDKEDDLLAYVIESGKEKSGVVASVVVKSGKITKGMQLVSQGLDGSSVEGKVKGLFNDLKEPVSEVLPGYPVQILGFAEIPLIGAKVVEFGKSDIVESRPSVTGQKQVEEGQIGVLIKSSDSGSLEALTDTLPESVVVVLGATGDVNESDVLSAKASNLSIFAYKSKIPSSVKKLAETEGVATFRFEIIYKLLEKIDELIAVGRQEVLGEAEIVAAFPYNKQRVAGSKIVKGTIKKGDTLKLVRGDKELGTVKAMSLRKEKTAVDQVGQGEEFGVIIAPQLDFAQGDMLISVAKK